MFTKQEAIKQLADFDHAVITKEAAAEICEPFGAKVPREIHYPDAFRKDGKPVIGIAAHDVARHICDTLGISYVPQFGKGSALRMCCKALTDYVTTENTTS